MEENKDLTPMEFAKKIRSEISEFRGSIEFNNSFLNKVYNAVDHAIDDKEEENFYKGKLLVHTYEEYYEESDDIYHVKIYIDKYKHLWMEKLHCRNREWLGEDEVIPYIFKEFKPSKNTIRSIKEDFIQGLKDKGEI